MAWVHRRRKRQVRRKAAPRQRKDVADSATRLEVAVRVNLKLAGEPHTQREIDAMTKRISKRIAQVTIKRFNDDSPDTSHLGEYSDREKTDYAIDRRHSLDCPVNTGTDGKLLWYSSGSGRIELQMTM